MNLSTRIQSGLSRRAMQPLWEGLYKVCVRGMGYNNYDPEANGEFRALREVLGRGRRRPVVIDAGANEGDFTAAVLAAAPGVDVHAFEPNPPTFARLSHRFEGKPGVRLNRAGLADQPGELELADYAGSGGSGHASFCAAGLATIQPEGDTDLAGRLVHHRTAVTTLDAYAEAQRLDHVDYLKIDVEGYERQVLEGAAGLIAGRRVAAIQLEINAHNAVEGFTLYQLTRLLAGYRCLKILPDGLYPIRYRALHDLFRYANFLFLAEEDGDAHRLG